MTTEIEGLDTEAIGDQRDLAEVIIDFWRREQPDQDMTTKLLALRLRRSASHLERAIRQEFGSLDLDTCEVESLLSLRRAPDECKSAGTLQREAQVTSGAITHRVARLEERGLVTREVDPRDRRHVLVRLTAAGHDRANELMATKTSAEQRLFAGLTPDARQRLAEDLKTLLLSLEGPATDTAVAEACLPAPPATASERRARRV